MWTNEIDTKLCELLISNVSTVRISEVLSQRFDRKITPKRVLNRMRRFYFLNENAYSLYDMLRQDEDK